MNDLAEFARLVEALRPWRHQLVFVGGWAHRLYRQHPSAAPPAYLPLATRDADVAIRDREPLAGNIQQALLDAGFKEELTGQHRPPVSQYSLGDETAGFYAEFLTPLRGSGWRRSGEPDATVLTAGITAQKLRHLDLLLVGPWQVTLPVESGSAAAGPVAVWIPNPTSFIVQKVLIRRDRLPAKRAQDALYIHDTLELFGVGLPVLANTWESQIVPVLTKKQRQEISTGVSEMFSSVTDTLREAARIPQDRTLRPERMQAFCDQALQVVLR